MNWIYVLMTIALTCYGQLVLKWQANLAGEMPLDPFDKVRYLFSVAFKPWMITVFVAAFLAYLSWIAAMTKFSISQVYPFMGLTFLIVMFFSVWLFDESLTFQKVIGTTLVVFGLALIAR